MKSFSDYAFVANFTEDSSGYKLRDNIAIAKKPLHCGLVLYDGARKITLKSDMPVGSLFSIKDIDKGEYIISFGITIGKARCFIDAGSLIDDNACSEMETEIYSNKTFSTTPQKGRYDPLLLKRTFRGFPCKVTIDGKEGGGTENIVAILSTVKCSAVAVKNIAFLARKRLLHKYPHVTDVVAITHESGCGIPEGGAKEELLQILVRIMNHPNIGFVFLLGLGCEHLTPCSETPENIIPFLRSKVIDFDKRVMSDKLQHYLGELEAIEQIVDGPIKELLRVADKRRRKPLPISYLTLGLKCGGSDIFSGICANPVLGRAVDKLVKGGGAAIITEIPEFDGYMHIIAERARNEEVARKLRDLLPTFDRISKQYPIPGIGRQKVAPGNKKGGLLNIFVKSASAAQKCGNAVIEGVLDYGDWIYDKDLRGLWVLNAPSYDQISTTALGLSGSQIVAFTTGLGTPIGAALSQVIKIGNRYEMGLKKHVDFFTESVLKGRSIEEVGDELFEYILSVASGDVITNVSKINREIAQKGIFETHHEFTLWKRWGDN